MNLEAQALHRQSSDSQEVPENRGRREGPAHYLCPQTLRFYLVEAQYRVWLSVHWKLRQKQRCWGGMAVPLGSSAGGARQVKEEIT